MVTIVRYSRRLMCGGLLFTFDMSFSKFYASSIVYSEFYAPIGVLYASSCSMLYTTSLSEVFDVSLSSSSLFCASSEFDPFVIRYASSSV